MNTLKELRIKIRIWFKRRHYAGDLIKLARIHGTDKWNSHWYARHYKKHFQHLRKRKLAILEIGVGGDEDPLRGGESLRMWQDYFPRGMIYSIDIQEKRLPREKRIKIFKGSQADEKFLRNVARETGALDIIIDDGSHVNEHVIKTFKTLFPFLKNGGIYAIEDTQTSYWPEYGGHLEDPDRPDTLMHFFKTLADGLNYMEFPEPACSPSYFDRNITSIHFYHNLIVIYKGPNNEKSNVLK